MIVFCVQMRSIKHENVNGFIGVCIDAPNVCYLTFYCKNGSIQDIVQDEDFDLGTEFKISFAMDIAQVTYPDALVSLR